MNQQMPTSEVLNRAADLIEERGWVQQRMMGPRQDTWGGGAEGDAPMCIEGGILAAMGVAIPAPEAVTNYVRENAITELATCPAYLAVKEHLRVGRLFLWNDCTGRTATEVIEVLRATAVIEAAREQQPAPVAVTA